MDERVWLDKANKGLKKMPNQIRMPDLQHAVYGIIARYNYLVYVWIFVDSLCFRYRNWVVRAEIEINNLLEVKKPPAICIFTTPSESFVKHVFNGNKLSQAMKRLCFPKRQYNFTANSGINSPRSDMPCTGNNRQLFDDQFSITAALLHVIKWLL